METFQSLVGAGSFCLRVSSGFACPRFAPSASRMDTESLPCYPLYCHTHCMSEGDESQEDEYPGFKRTSRVWFVWEVIFQGSIDLLTYENLTLIGRKCLRLEGEKFPLSVVRLIPRWKQEAQRPSWMRAYLREFRSGGRSNP